MGFFDALVRTVVNVATLPVDIVKDVATFGGIFTDQEKPYTVQKLEQIKDEAMGDRYLWIARCPKCGKDNDIYYAPSCGIKMWKCEKCKKEYKLNMKLESKPIRKKK